MKVQSIFLTVKYKLHRPSARKRALIEQVLREYTRGYTSLLDYAQPRFVILAENCQYKGKLSAKNLAGALYRQKELLNDLNVPGCIRESLCKDVAAALVSYYELGDEASFPTCRDYRPGGGWHEALDNLIYSLDDLDLENDLVHEVSRRAHWRSQYMPILFCRNRNFTLARKVGSDTLYAILPLAPNGIGKMTGEPMVDIFTGEIFEKRGRTQIVVPLELSRKHRDWHTRFFNLGAQPKVAKLMQDGDNFYLCVTVEYKIEIRETKTILGIDLGVNDLIAARVINYNGNIIANYQFNNRDFLEFQRGAWLERRQLQQNGSAKAKGHRVRRLNEELSHIAVNAIVKLASKHDSQVVVEFLKGLDKNAPKFRKLRLTNYRRVKAILDYKLPLAGLPKPEEVCPAYTSQRCPVCGHIAKENRPKRDDWGHFCCVACDYEDNADLGAAANIAHRYQSIKSGQGCDAALHCAKRKIEQGKEIKCSFAKEAYSLTIEDLRQVEVSQPEAGLGGV